MDYDLHTWMYFQTKYNSDWKSIIIMYLSKFDKNEAYIILRMIYNVIASLSLPNLKNTWLKLLFEIKLVCKTKWGINKNARIFEDLQNNSPLLQY